MNTIYLIDWDDTLFPTLWIKQNNINIYNQFDIEKYKLYFIELDETIEKFLHKLNNNSMIFIVSNASLKWINACLNILPFTKQYIISNNIKIISARDLYSIKYKINDWKKYTFQNIINSIKVNKYNIISLGDADYEYKGLISLKEFIKNKNFLLKNITFIENPSFEQLIDQQELLIKCIGNIVNKQTFVDMKLS